MRRTVSLRRQRETSEINMVSLATTAVKARDRVPHRSFRATDGEKATSMFRESLLENCIERTPRRKLTTLISFGVQAAIACVCVALPLLYPEAIPALNAYRCPELLPSSGIPSRPPELHHQTQSATAPAANESALTIREPHEIPTTIDRTADRVTSAASSDGPWLPGALPANGGAGSQLLTQLLNRPMVHPTIKTTPPSVRLSQGVTQGMLVHRVEPRYPDLARTARIQGEVVLLATIGRDGSIENLRILSGHPLLAQSAIDAVKQWRYRPYLLDHEPVEVETQITVRFTLN
jgi:protein TonB